MMLVCGFLGCLSQAFKRTSSSTSLSSSEQPNPSHQHGDRHQNGDRNHHGRGPRPLSHNGVGLTSPHPPVNGSPGANGMELERRVTPVAPFSSPPAPAQVSPFENDLPSSSAAASAAALAAATQPAMLVKLDRGGPSRRTPLHIAAERGQLHVLSAIIESLCCAATAALIAEDCGDTAAARPTGDGSGGSQRDVAADGSRAAARSRRGSAATGDGGGDGGGSRGGRPGSMAAIGNPPGAGQATTVPSEDGEAGAQNFRQHHRHHAANGPMGVYGQAYEGQQQHHHHHHHSQQLHQLQRGSMGIVEEFPVARPGISGAPLAPEQYIQFHLNMQDADGTTALSLACRFGHVDCCRLLLANGSARTLSDARGNTPLHYAALRGHLGVVFMLLDEFVEPGQEEELGGYVDARNHAGCTPLHYAVWGRQSGSVQVLLQHGADVLPRNSRPAQELTPPVMVVGSTPLHLAAARGHVEICRIILKTFAERVLEPLQLSEDDPQPPSLASLDPRVQVNANGHMPYQVAQRLGFYPLAMLLRPSIPILRLFSDEERAVRFYGPAPLRAIAAEALNKKLVSELDALALTSPPPPPPAAAAARIGDARNAGANAQQQSIGETGSDAASRRPVSAPATLEQLAAAAALEAAEARAAAAGGSHHNNHHNRHHHHHHHPHGPAAGAGSGEAARLPAGTRASAGPSTATVSGSVGSVAAANAAGGPSGRRITPPRQLNVEIAVAGGTLDTDGRPSAQGRRPLVVEPSTGSTTPSGTPGGNSATPPRTPPVVVPVGAQLLSPSSISPRLTSPFSMSPSVAGAALGVGSPSSGGGASGSASPAVSLHTPLSPPALQLPTRGSSARRSTPPLASNRSSNSMLSAAPMAAALSRPPSAPRANGQPSETSRAAVVLSLPGQPDVPELQTPVRLVQGREQDGGESAAAPAALVAGDADSATGPDGGSVAGGGGGPAEGPRTPVRQPSSGVLHVRRTPASSSGAVAGAAVAAAVTAGAAVGSRPVTPSLATMPSFGATAGVDGGPAAGGSRRSSIEGGRPPVLLRLRSNPLFVDGADTVSSAVAGSLVTAVSVGGGGLAGSMPPLAEDDEAPSTAAAAAAAAAAALRGSARGGLTRPAVSSFGAAHGPVATAAGPSPHSAPPPQPAASSTSPDAPAFGRPTTAAAAVAAVAAALAADGDDEDLECGVCMEPLPMVSIAPCRHQICGPCARRICCLNIQKPSHCPFCRATISAFVAPAPVAS